MLDSDITFFEADSRRPDDTNGGQITNRAITSGQVGNLVPPIADADKVSGFVAGYKFYVAADTPDTDVYYKPWIFISKPPADSEVGVVLLFTDSWFDRWAEARKRLEEYLAISGRWFCNVYGLQLANQKGLQIYQRPDSELPSVGEVYAISNQYGTQAAHNQLVRVTDIKVTRRTVSVGSVYGTFDFIDLSLAERLDADYDGGNVQFGDTSGRAELHTTRIADAVMLYGIKALQEEAGVLSNTVKVDSIYHQLVPTATQSTNLPNMDISGKSRGLVASGQGTYLLTTAAPLGPGLSVYMGAAFVPGTLSVNGTLTDNGRGNLLSGSTIVANLDYVQGIVTGVDGAPTYTGLKTFAFAMAGAPAQHVHSTSIGVDAFTRRENYVLTLGWVPAPGSLMVSYIAAGKVYKIWDWGAGILSGSDTSHGVGQFRWDTNTLQFTLVYQPDPDTEIIISSGVLTTTTQWGGRALTPEFRFQCQNPGGLPGTFVVTWPDGSAVDDGKGRLFSGTDEVGTVRYSALPGPLVIVRPMTLPPPGALFSVTYEHGAPQTMTVQNPTLDGGGFVTIQLPDTDIHPGSIEVEYLAGDTQYVAVDDGQGHFIGRPSTETANYVDGQVHIHPNQTIVKTVAQHSMVTTGVLTKEQRSKLM